MTVPTTKLGVNIPYYSINGEDYTAAKLKGIPIFCVNRVYRIEEDQTPYSNPFILKHYIFRFDNGFGASVVEFTDKKTTGGEPYELAVLDDGGDLHYGTCITSDTERGDEIRIHNLLCMIEDLEPF